MSSADGERRLDPPLRDAAGEPAIDDDARFVVTGPTGWIGRAMLDRLAARLGPSWRDRVTVFGSSERLAPWVDGRPLQIRILAAIAPADVADASVVHLAYLTKDRLETGEDADFLAANLAIDQSLLRAMRQAPPRALFVASSGAAAGVGDPATRNLYGVAKLIQEDVFLQFAAEHDARVLVGRIYNIAGPFINKLDAYALSAFLRQALTQQRIEIAATSLVFRSYLHVFDLCTLILRSLQGVEPLPRAPLDLCGTEVVEMADIARAAASATGLGFDAIRRPALDLARTSRYLGDATQTLSLAARCGVTLSDFPTQVADTASYLRETSARR